MHKMAFAHVFGPEKKNGFGPFSYKFFVCIRVGLRWDQRLLFSVATVLLYEYEGLSTWALLKSALYPIGCSPIPVFYFLRSKILPVTRK